MKCLIFACETLALLNTSIKVSFPLYPQAHLSTQTCEAHRCPALHHLHQTHPQCFAVATLSPTSTLLWISTSIQVSTPTTTRFFPQQVCPSVLGFFFFPFFAYLFGEVSWHLYKPCHGLRFKYFHMPCFFQIFHCVYKKKMFMKFTFIKMQRCNRAVKQPAARKRWLNSTKTSSRDEHVSAWSKYLPWWCEAAILDITTVPSCRQYDSKTGVMIGVRTQLFLHKVVLKLH